MQIEYKKSEFDRFPSEKELKYLNKSFDRHSENGFYNESIQYFNRLKKYERVRILK